MNAPLPRAPTDVAGECSRERILRVATGLFGRHGFDGVTTRTIAAAAGLNVATVAHHTGSKAQLHESVFARLHDHEAAVLDLLLADVGEDDITDPVRIRKVLRRLVDGYVDVLQADPDIARLWTRRWLETTCTCGDAELERRYARPLLIRVEALLRQAQEAGSVPPLDTQFAVKSVVWITYGFFTGGLVEPHAVHGVTDPAQVDRLRALVHQVVDGLVGPA